MLRPSTSPIRLRIGTGSALALLLGLASAANAQRIANPQPQSDAVADRFGGAIAAEAGWLLVGATGEDTAGGANAGAVYAFELQAGSYVQQARLVATDGGANDGFGAAIAVHGDLAVIGAWEDDNGNGSDAGAAYIFQRSGSSWTQIAKLVAPDGATGDEFGSAVGISAAGVLVGAPQDDITGVGVNVGSAHLFQSIGGQWTAVSRLLASDPAINSYFGAAVAVAGNLALVGAEGLAHDAGAAYAYQLAGSSTQFEQKLVSSDRADFDQFGDAIAISGATAVIGARGHAGVIGSSAGAAYIFQRSGQSWTQQAKLQPADLQPGDSFGRAVTIKDQALLVGAPLTRDGACCEQGIAHLYLGSGSNWRRIERLVASDSATFDMLGSSVALDAERALAGAPLGNDAATGILDAGSVLRFARGVPLFKDGFEP